jgi:hypothetical protein
MGPADRERWKQEYYSSLYMNLHHVDTQPSPLYLAWTGVARSGYTGYLRVRSLEGCFASGAAFAVCLANRDSLVVMDDELLDLAVECTILAHDALTLPKHCAEDEIFNMVQFLGVGSVEGMLARAGNLYNRLCSLALERDAGDAYRSYALGVYGLRYNNERYEFMRVWSRACSTDVEVYPAWHQHLGPMAPAALSGREIAEDK